MDHKSGAVFIQQINNRHEPVARAAADHKPLLPVQFARKPAARVPYYGFNFSNRTAMFRGVVEIPLNPAELRRCHDITIWESADARKATARDAAEGQMPIDGGLIRRDVLFWVCRQGPTTDPTHEWRPIQSSCNPRFGGCEQKNACRRDLEAA